MTALFYYSGEDSNGYRTQATHKRAALVVQVALLSRLTNSCRLGSDNVVGRLLTGVNSTNTTNINVSQHGGTHVN